MNEKDIIAALSKTYVFLHRVDGTTVRGRCVIAPTQPSEQVLQTIPAIGDGKKYFSLRYMDRGTTRDGAFSTDDVRDIEVDTEPNNPKHRPSKW